MPLATHVGHLLLLAVAGIGQALLVAFAWGFAAVILLHESLSLPYSVAQVMVDYPTETTLSVSLIATVFSLLTTSFFSIAFKEALRHRMHNPVSLIYLTGGIALTRGDFYFGFKHMGTTVVTLCMFALTKMMVSCWTTLLSPTIVAYNVTATGSELDLNSSYFESTLNNQFLASGGAISSQGNSIEIIDIDGLLSGITTAQYSFGVRGILDFNGVFFNTSTGGVLPAAPGYTGSQQSVQPSNTGLNFVGGAIPPNLQSKWFQNQTLSSNFTVIQQGLTADVVCTQLQTDSVTLASTTTSYSGIFTGNADTLSVSSYNLTCPEGNPAQQDYVIRGSNQGNISSAGILASLVCPYPIGQSQLDWTQFNVTTVGSGKYGFLQSTTCQITPQVTTSLVAYANQALNVTVVNRTALTSNNPTLALFLASIIDNEGSNTQGLVSNSMGDALYSISVSNGTSTSNSGIMSPALIEALEQYWRGVIEFSGTYLRSGFSVIPNATIPSDALASIRGNQTATSMGWNKRSPTYLYTALPVTFFALATWAAIGYALFEIIMKDGRKFTTFDPTNPIHLVMVSSTRTPGDTDNLEGERIGGFSQEGIDDNENLRVALDDVDRHDEKTRKRFRLLAPLTDEPSQPLPQEPKGKQDLADVQSGSGSSA